MKPEPNLVEVVYRSTIYYVLESPVGVRLMIDCGWPGTFGQMRHELQRKGIAPSEVHYILVTHFHPDHAGLVEEMKREGARLLLTEEQLPWVGKLHDYVKRDSGYIDIETSDAIVLRAPESRGFLAKLGIHGEVVSTPGHSPDSISLVLDDGRAFTGDLPRPDQIASEDAAANESWRLLRSRGVKRVLPAHGGSFLLP